MSLKQESDTPEWLLSGRQNGSLREPSQGFERELRLTLWKARHCRRKKVSVESASESGPNMANFEHTILRPVLKLFNMTAPYSSLHLEHTTTSRPDQSITFDIIVVDECYVSAENRQTMQLLVTHSVDAGMAENAIVLHLADDCWTASLPEFLHTAKYADISPRLAVATYLRRNLPDWLDLKSPSSKRFQGPCPANAAYAEIMSLADVDRARTRSDEIYARAVFDDLQKFKSTTTPVLASGDVLLITPIAPFSYLSEQAIYDLETLPKSTLLHMESSLRPKNVSIADCWTHPSAINVYVDRTIQTDGADGTGQTVLFCRLQTTPEGGTNDWPSLVVKVYDERGLVPDLSKFISSAAWRSTFDNLQTAAEMLQHEYDLYQRLAHAQGSLVPYCYGMLELTLLDGSRVLALALENVVGPTLEQSAPGNLEESKQIGVIQSAREAVRLLQHADVSQRDMHAGQFIIHESEDNHMTFVCIDLASMYYSTTHEDQQGFDTFADVHSLLVDEDHDYEDAMPEDMVTQHFGSREWWDTYG